MGGYNGDQQGGYPNEYGGDNSGEWDDQHTSYYQQDTNQSPPSYSRGTILYYQLISTLALYCLKLNVVVSNPIVVSCMAKQNGL